MDRGSFLRPARIPLSVDAPSAHCALPAHLVSGLTNATIVTLPQHQQLHPVVIPGGRLPKSLTPPPNWSRDPIPSRLYALCPVLWGGVSPTTFYSTLRCLFQMDGRWMMGLHTITRALLSCCSLARLASCLLRFHACCLLARLSACAVPCHGMLDSGYLIQSLSHLPFSRPKVFIYLET